MDDPNVVGLLKEVHSSITKLTPLMTNLSATPLTEKLTTSGSQGALVEIINDHAKLLSELLNIYVTLLGENSEKVPELTDEKIRVERYLEKFQSWENKQRKKNQVDTETVKRFIDATLSSNTPIISSKETDKQIIEKKLSNDKKTEGKVGKPKKKKRSKKNKNES